ncbi:MAG: TolC family protein [Gudongella sp.]|nr:TolC family protein [Gudongella sp.]
MLIKSNILIVLIILLMSIPVYADELIEETFEFSLNSAIEYAIENSKEMELQRLEVSKSELQYAQNKKAVNSAKDLYEITSFMPRTYQVTDEDSINKALVKNGASMKQVELARNISIWNLQKKENEIRYNVERSYFDLKRSEQDLTIAQDNLTVTDKQYNLGQLKFNAGLISKQQLLGLELASAQAQSSRDAAEMMYIIQDMSFKLSMNLPLVSNLKLTDEIQEVEYQPIELVEAIEFAFENNLSLRMVEESYEIQKLILKATSGRFPPVTYKYREQAAEVAKAEINLDNVKNAVEMNVRSSYLNLITSQKQIETFELMVQQASDAQRIAEVSFELGQNTAVEVTQANINLMNAKKSLAQQIHNYNLAVLDFEYIIGIGK